MSGIEIAGLILSAIPLIISTLEHYRAVKPFWKWRSLLDSLTRDLLYQHTSFQLTMEILLIPITNDADRQEMLNNPRSDLWKRGSVDGALQRRLGRAYLPFKMILKDMEDIMKTIGQKLNLPREMQAQRSELEALILANPQLSQRSSGQFDFEKRIMSSSGSKEIDRLFGQVKYYNQMLDTFTDKSSQIENLLRSSSSQSPTFVTPLNLLRHHATSLHSAVGSALGCESHSTHRLSLILEDRTSRALERCLTTSRQTSLAFNMAFQHPNRPTEWRSALVKIIENTPDGTVIPTAAPQCVSDCSRLSNIHVVTNAPIRNLCLSILETMSDYFGLQLEPSGVLHSTAAPVLRPAKHCGTVRTLSDVLGDSSGYLTLKHRYILAIVVVSSFLQLYGTPWFSSGLHKRSIYFFRINSEGISVDIDHPFVSCNHFSGGRGPQIQIHDDDTHLFNLGVLLLEIQLCKRFEDWCNVEDELLNPQLIKNWMAKEEGNISHAFRKAILYCLVSFLDHKSNLQDPVFIRTVEDHILVPLQLEYRVFREGPLPTY